MGFTWSAESMDSRSLVLQIDFENPLYVSTEYGSEQLEIQILDMNTFLSIAGLPLQTGDAVSF